jgi:hypothetical protein
MIHRRKLSVFELTIQMTIDKSLQSSSCPQYSILRFDMLYLFQRLSTLLTYHRTKIDRENPVPTLSETRVGHHSLVVESRQTSSSLGMDFGGLAADKRW